MVIVLTFFPVFEVHEELTKLIKAPFKGFVLVGETGFLVDTSFDNEDEINTAVMVANWVKISLDRIRSELGLKEERITVLLSLEATSYLFRQLGRELYVVFVLDGVASPPVLGSEEEMILQKVEMIVEGKPVEEVEVVAGHPTLLLTGKVGNPYEAAEAALKLFKDAISKIEGNLTGSPILNELKDLASATQRLEGSLSVFKKTIDQLEAYSRDISKLSELILTLTSALDSMKNYSEKLLEMMKGVREAAVYSEASMKPSFVEEVMNNLRMSIEAAMYPEEAAKKLNEAINQLIKKIRYLHPALFEMRSYCRIFKESSPEEYEALKKEFLSSFERWKTRLMAVERVLSG